LKKSQIDKLREIYLHRVMNQVQRIYIF